MSKRALAMLLAAVLVVGLVTAVVASSMGGSGSSDTMPNGQTMGGTDKSNQTMTMSNGQTMSGSDMNMDMNP